MMQNSAGIVNSKRKLVQDNEGVTLTSRKERKTYLITEYTFIMFIYFAIIVFALVLGLIGTSDGCKDLVLNIEIEEDVEPCHDQSDT